MTPFTVVSEHLAIFSVFILIILPPTSQGWCYPNFTDGKRTERLVQGVAQIVCERVNEVGSPMSCTSTLTMELSSSLFHVCHENSPMCAWILFPTLTLSLLGFLNFF